MALSSACAIIGMCSLMCVPGILVLIGLNSPRMFAGASGLGSQISMWLGPPCRKIMITVLATAESARAGVFAGRRWRPEPVAPEEEVRQIQPQHSDRADAQQLAPRGSFAVVTATSRNDSA